MIQKHKKEAKAMSSSTFQITGTAADRLNELTEIIKRQEEEIARLNDEIVDKQRLKYDYGFVWFIVQYFCEEYVNDIHPEKCAKDLWTY